MAADFNRAARLGALNRLADRIVQLLEEDDDLSAKEIRDLAVSLGIAVQRSAEERGETRPEPQTVNNTVVVIRDTSQLSPERLAELDGLRALGQVFESEEELQRATAGARHLVLVPANGRGPLFGPVYLPPADAKE